MYKCSEAHCSICQTRNLGLCHLISGKTRQNLARSSHIHSYAANRIVWDEGSDPNFTAILETGYLRLQRYGIDGRRQILCLFTPGDIVGGPKSWGSGYSVAASVDSTICRFDSRIFETQIEQDSDLRRAIYILRAAKLDQLRWLTCLLGALNAEERLCAFLSIATKFMPCQRDATGTITMTVDLPRTDIADLLGTTVESISRITNRLDGLGVLKINGARTFVITDPARLIKMGCLQGTIETLKFPTDFRPAIESKFQAPGVSDRIGAQPFGTDRAINALPAMKKVGVEQPNFAGVDTRQ